jgi:oxygen-independent coproporphyrinogen-3 oxidase
MALYRGVAPKTLYIGGGTPSVLDVEQFSILDGGLKRYFSLDCVREFSIEANPDTVDEERVEAWLNAGVNRISLGVQSFDDSVLAAVDRRTREKDILNAAKIMNEGGVANVGIDLMLGLQPSYRRADPERVFDIFTRDLRKAVSLGPSHISVYMLTVGADTPLGRMTSTCQHSILDDEDLENMYLYAVEFLAGYGFEQYELSNFALPGKESVHNMQYWQGKNYIGLGTGSVSTIGCTRTRNSEVLERYVECMHEQKKPVVHEEVLSGEALFVERIMLSLRMTRGLDMDALMSVVPEPRKSQLQLYVDSLSAHGLARCSGSRLQLTPSGMFRSNAIISDIVRFTGEPENRHS